MRFTYDTATDSITVPELDDEQTRVLQSKLSAALARNEPVQDVVKMLLAAARSGDRTVD
jgi:hypothetical protein